MVRRWIAKFSRATTGLPALSTQRFGGADPKAMKIFLLIVLQPLQGLSLWAGNAPCAFKGWEDRHVRFHFGQDGHFPGLPNLTLRLAMDVAQIANHNVGTPRKTTPTIVNTRLEQITLRNMRGRVPTDYRDQTNRRGIAVEPQP